MRTFIDALREVGSIRANKFSQGNMWDRRSVVDLRDGSLPGSNRDQNPSAPSSPAQATSGI